MGLPISSPLTHMVNLLPLLSSRSKNVSARPSDPDTMMIIVLEAIVPSSGISRIAQNSRFDATVFRVRVMDS